MSHVDPRLWPAVRPLLDRALRLEGEERRRFLERAGDINEAVRTVLVHLVRNHEAPATAGPSPRRISHGAALVTPEAAPVSH